MESTIKTNVLLPRPMAIRFQGKWFGISAKPYEPERQTYQIAWSQIKKKIGPEQAYREWFAQEQKDAKLLYPSFRKDA
jgi:hypothetical protein